MSKFGQKGEQHFLAVIGDLRRSREDLDRARTQLRLEAALESINRKFAGDLAARFIITLGDEFQGLLKIPGDVFRVIKDIDHDLEGLPIRFGLGWGSLSTESRPEAIGMDGPCFHHARAAILRSKDEDRAVVVAGFGEQADLALNGVLALMEGVRQRWKPAQAETVRLMTGRSLQKEVAKLRGVSTSVVSETLKSTLYRPMLESEHSLELLMNHFAESMHPSTNMEAP